MLRDELDAALTKGQRDVGLYLDELDDHFLALKSDGEVLAVWNATSATVTEIRREAEHHARGTRIRARYEK